LRPNLAVRLTASQEAATDPSSSRRGDKKTAVRLAGLNVVEILEIDEAGGKQLLQKYLVDQGLSSSEVTGPYWPGSLISRKPLFRPQCTLT